MPREVIVGISNLDTRSHDNAACVLVDGTLVAQAEEERFVRHKRAYDSLPKRALEYCLQKADVTPNEIAVLTVGWDLPRTSYDNSGAPVFTGESQQVAHRLFPNEKFSSGKPEVEFISHHLAHAAVAYLTSGFRSAAILVVDGAGENEATTHWHARGGDLKQILSQDQMPDSLGFMYEGVSEYLGFRGSEAGKVMGLAPYGGEAKPFDIVSVSTGYEVQFPLEIYCDIEKQYARREQYYVMEMIRDMWIRYCETLFGPKEQFQSCLPHEVNVLRAQIAARLQATLEVAMLSAAESLRVTTGEENLCVGGGVALNCSANGKIEQSGLFKNVFIYPASNDAGVALGSALFEHKRRHSGAVYSPLLSQNAYWGPEFSDAEILQKLQEQGEKFSRCSEDFSDIAELLDAGNVVAWFQGRMEIGPRALGGRSILADPRSIAMRDRVNIIKERELWRPLAPSILEGYEDEYFDSAVFSPFMLKAATVKAEKRAQIPAIVHVDGSSRYQSVKQDLSPSFWKLIESFRKRTGIPLVLNTSFNDQEPIVCSPADALRTFHAREIDHLVLGSFLISKSSNGHSHFSY